MGRRRLTTSSSIRSCRLTSRGESWRPVSAESCRPSPVGVRRPSISPGGKRCRSPPHLSMSLSLSVLPHFIPDNTPSFSNGEAGNPLPVLLVDRLFNGKAAARSPGGSRCRVSPPAPMLNNNLASLGFSSMLFSELRKQLQIRRPNMMEMADMCLARSRGAGCILGLALLRSALPLCGAMSVASPHVRFLRVLRLASIWRRRAHRQINVWPTA